jgi:hypothetical protein
MGVGFPITFSLFNTSFGNDLLSLPLFSYVIKIKLCLNHLLTYTMFLLYIFVFLGLNLGLHFL